MLFVIDFTCELCVAENVTRFLRCVAANNNIDEDLSKSAPTAIYFLKEGEKREASGDFAGAIGSYTKALAIEDHYLLHYKRGCVYQKIGDLEQAAADFEVFIVGSEEAARKEIPKDGFRGGVEAANRAAALKRARSAITKVAFRRILKPVNPFDVDFSSKKFYDWKLAAIADTPEETLMLKEKPHEAAYRMGVKSLLLGKYEEAIRSLGEAIRMKPEDARFFLFRGMAYALQSSEGGLLGSSRGTEELGKSESESDLARALELSKGNESLEHVCLRTKHSLTAYENDLTSRRAMRSKAVRSVPWGFVGAFAFLLGSIWTIIGIGEFVTYASSAQLVNMINGLSFVLGGVIELFGVFSVYKGKRKLGGLLILVGIVILYLLIT